VDHVEGIRRMAAAGDPAFVESCTRGICGARCAISGCSTTSAIPSEYALRYRYYAQFRAFSERL
jgi:hypothetical protein